MKKKLLSFVFAVIVVVFIITIGANYLSYKYLTPDFIKEKIKNEYNLDASFNSIKGSFGFFSYNLSLDELCLKDNKDVIFKVENPGVKINLLPLILKKLSIKEIEGSNIKFNLVRLEDGTLNISKYLKNKAKVLTPDLTDLKTNIKGYTININDLITNSNFQIQGNTLTTKGLDFNKKLSFYTTGNMIFPDGNKTPYLIDIEYFKKGKSLKIKRQEFLLSGVDLSFLKNYFKQFGFEEFEGTVDICSEQKENNSFNISLYMEKVNVVFDYKGEKNSIISNAPIIGSINFDFNSNEFNIIDSYLMGDEISLGLKGKIKNIFNLKKIEPILTLDVQNTSLIKLASILPDTVIPMQENYIKNIKKYKGNGIINGEIKVHYKNLKEYSIDGKIVLNDIYLKNRPKNARTSFGECIFNGKKADIKVWVNTPNDGAVTVFGTALMKKNSTAKFDINSVKEFDLEFAQSILKPLQLILGIEMGPLPYMDIKGIGEIHLKTKGNRQFSELFGYFDGKNVTTSMQGLNAVLNDGEVHIDFKGKDIFFDGAKGKISNSITTIDGKATTLGDIDLTVNVKDISAKKANNIAKTSMFVTNALDGGDFLNSFNPTKGNIDFTLNLKGNIPPDAVFGEPSDSVLAKGEIIFKGVDVTLLPNIKASDTKGLLTFEKNTQFNLATNFYGSPIKIKGSIGQKNSKGRIIKDVPSDINLTLTSSIIKSKSVGNFIKNNLALFNPETRLFLKTLSSIFETNNFDFKGNIKTKGQVYSDATTLDLSGFEFDGKIEGINSKNSNVKFKSGNITLKGKDAYFSNLGIILSDINLNINGKIAKFASEKPFNDLKIVFHKSNLSSYFDIMKKLLNNKGQDLAKNIGNVKGKVRGSIKLHSDKIDGEFIPENVSMSIKGGKAELKGGKIKIQNEKIYLKAITLLYEELPVLIDGFIESQNDNPEFNLYTSFNLNEENCDKLLNPLLKYPVTITGETIIKGRIQGRADSYITYLTTIVDTGSDLSFMGLTLGDTDSKREISAKIKFTGTRANINHIKYSKYLLSQNNKQTLYDLIKIYGGIKLSGKNTEFKNLRIITPNNAHVRFLNPIFKKSVLKDGLFTANITLNGTEINPKVTGDMEFSNVIIPMYGSVVDKIKIKLNKDKGEAIADFSVFNAKAQAKVLFENRFIPPYIIDDIAFKIDELKISDIKYPQTNQNSPVSKPANTLSPTDIRIKKGNILVDKIFFNGVQGNNLKVNFSHNQKGILLIDSTYLAIADGLIKGSGKYDFQKNSTDATLSFMNCSADILTKAFLNLSGQIYGSANGEIEISLKDFNPSDYLNKLKAEVEFEIQDGKMPKLGSIEYLLRASNLIKSGIFGLTLNNIIEVLTPYKSGNFNKITGVLKIDDAKIKDLKIYSQGKNLSTYTYGTYDITSGFVAVEILGKLSKNISNLLGPIGNTSVISILNIATRNKMDAVYKTELMHNISKIPLINFNNEDFRLFSAKLNGKVNAQDVVKSFNWLN